MLRGVENLHTNDAPLGVAATVTDPTQFRSGRQFAAWLGLTPLNNSTGGKERLGRISKMGDQYLRRLLVTGMTSLVRRNKHHPGSADPRITPLLARKPPRLVTVAMANRAARAIWAIMVRGEIYRMPALGCSCLRTSLSIKRGIARTGCEDVK